MRDEDAGEGERRAEIEEEVEDGGASLAIEAARRLVGEKEGGATRDGARDRDALLLTAGELVRELVGVILQADRGKRLECARPAIRLDRDLDVLDGAERAKQVERLEDEADLAAAVRAERAPSCGRQIDAADDDAALVRAVERAEQREERALARAGRTDERDQLATRYGERDASQNGLFSAAKGLLDAAQVEISSVQDHRARRMKRYVAYTMLLAGVIGTPAEAWAQEVPAEEDTVDLSNEPDLVRALDAPPAPAAPKTPPRADKFEFRGYTRLTAGAGPFSVAPEQPGSAPQERVPYDRAFIEQHLYLDVRYSHGDWFRAVASASLSISAFDQVNRPSAGASTTSFDFQKPDAIVREAYVAFSLGRLDLRLGQQRIVWGNSDGYAPNDVLNGRDARNPFLLDSEMLELPAPAARADIDLGLGVLGLVFEPFLPSDRFDLYGTNWSIVQADAPSSYRRLFGALAQNLDRNAISWVTDTLSGGALGGSNPVNASAGASFKMHLGGADLSWYYQSGFDHLPAIYVDPAFQKKLEQTDATQLNGAVFDALLNQSRASTKSLGGPLQVSYRRRNHVGMDASTTAGPFVLRADIAYDSAKTFFSKDTLNASIRPAAQEVVGLEYQTGNLNKVVGLEVWAIQIFDPEIKYVPALDQGTNGPLLWYRDRSWGSGGLVRWLFADAIIFETRASVGIDPFWWSLRPEIGYQSPSFTVRAGVLALDGTAGAFGDYYRRNSTAYLTTRYSF